MYRSCDSWNSDDAPVQEARENLKQLGGVDVDTQPDWHILVTDLDPCYPDKSTFVPSVAACVQAWCESFSAVVEDEANEEWSEVLVERMKGRLRVFVAAGHCRHCEYVVN
ncbi:hypothetical protein F5X96DRAFT_672670 [Biscogniauxia mediterranea]|nr:hypothetical protein F5X96DRAFT_672670 [Biscogniauxia mediterranea]